MQNQQHKEEILQQKEEILQLKEEKEMTEDLLKIIILTKLPAAD